MKKSFKSFSFFLVISLFITMFLSAGNLKAAAIGQFEVSYIDVGQADCILIKQGNYNMLIDAGNNGDSTTIVNYLKSKGVSKLDIVVGTHPHEDHIGSLDTVINTFSIGKLYMPKVTNTTKTYEDVVNAIKAKGLAVNTPEPGSSFTLGNATFTILAPNSSSYGDLNNYSIVLKATFGNNSFLFAGDAEDVSEREMLSKGYNLKVDVLKVGHHGSDSSTTPEFLNVVNPKYAVISVGKDNIYGHPAATTIDKLRNKGTAVFRTDLQGTIVATSDGTNITFNVRAAINPVATTIGWSQVGTKWYYYKTDGTLANSWLLISNKYYYFDATGVMVTGWKLVGTKWYYFDISGAMTTIWKLIGSKWYYFDSSGYMKTGWLKVSTEWYYMDTSGVMKTGWAQLGTKWYYFYSKGNMAHDTTIGGCKLGSDGAWIK